MDDAAKIDGCSNFQVYRLIIMPIARPMLAIIALWSFIGPFMDYMLPKILLTGSESIYFSYRALYPIDDVRTMNAPAFAAGGLLYSRTYSYSFYSTSKTISIGFKFRICKGLEEK